MKLRILFLFTIIIILTYGNMLAQGTGTKADQTDQGDRSVNNIDGFGPRRPKRSASPRPKPIYKDRGTDNFFKRPAPHTTTVPTTKASKRAAAPLALPKVEMATTEVGITMWKLRLARSGEDGIPFECKDSTGTLKICYAERVDIGSEFGVGDRVRFGIESATNGYLYVFNREMHLDGTFGPPLPLFPAVAGQDNSIYPGMLVDVPDQRGPNPTFKLDPKYQEYAGELITVVVSPTPLPPMQLDRTKHLLNAEPLIAIEFSSSAKIYSQSELEDKLFTKAEEAASCGSAARELVPDGERTKGRPCGDGTRELDDGDPGPQAKYVVTAPKGKPAALLFKLAVRPR